jgi:transaldolase
MSENINLPKIRIYLDSASVEEMDYHYTKHKEYISGFTTNPTLMKNAGVKDYLKFVKNTIVKINDLPISFEVFADEIDEMKRQAMELAEISSNVCVKIPITNTRGVSTHGLVSELNKQGVFCNVTAIMTIEHVRKVRDSLASQNPIILSVFAGRIADSGRDPMPILKEICYSVDSFEQISILWASTRELYNIFQAEQAGCQIITVTAPLLNKLNGLGKNLETLSLETVEMFYKDAKSAGYTI